MVDIRLKKWLTFFRMRNKFFLKQKGEANKVLMGMLALFLLVSLPVSVTLVQKNQENRSSAASEVSDEYQIDEEDALTDSHGVCGSADGKTYASRPTYDLCGAGVLSWVDSNGLGGSYEWMCGGGEEIEDIESIEDIDEDMEDMWVSCSAVRDESGAVDGRCGEANGSELISEPNSNYLLCKIGNLTWIDEAGSDGDWNWRCEGENGGQTVDCLAVRLEEGF